ncbi:MAG: peptide chain release factor N(5)-glutamine methyltransferase [Psychromonas sp.]|nr:peptide chain release factor N(5)-glutamine methyltransferase [Psychromonas sp.]
MRIDKALSKATVALPYSDSALLDAKVLLAFVLNKEAIYLLTWPEHELTPDQQASFDTLIAQRSKGMPVAYLTGEREFWSLLFKVNRSTLIPRADTEILVEQALQYSKSTANILDLGTGTGAVILSIADELSDARCIGIDVNVDAVSLALENASNLNISNVCFYQSNWFDNITGKFDTIVSNPPYIDKKDPHLDCRDMRFEPLSALVANDKGLSDIKIIIEKGKNHLKGAGCLLIEHGFEQGYAVQQLFKQNGYHAVKTIQDYGKNDRVTLGVLKND